MMAWCQGTMQQKCKCHVNSVKFLFPIFFCNGRKQLLQKTEEALSWEYVASRQNLDYLLLNPLLCYMSNIKELLYRVPT